MKKELIFLGPPACGKGTQTDRLAKFMNIPHVDTGSLLRAEMKKGSPEGKRAESYVSNGQLVPVELVAEIIKLRLSQDDCKGGYILDGFPRSLEQAEILEKLKADLDKGIETDFRAIYFDVDPDVLLSRIINRRSCPSCGTIYNVKYNPPKVEGKCDNCDIDLIQRADDTEETAKKRFDTYYEQTAPLIDFYKNKGVLKTLNAQGGIEEVWERLKEVVGL